ncbi:MAG: serine/threonine protein kinase [Steroidobacteraceae bacterium]
MTERANRPFAALDPPAVLAAAESIGIATSGRLLALNSYENRVYQVADESGALWVFKFYRPARWRDAEIREEHDFALELAQAELPVAAPLQRDGETLFHLDGQRFAAFEYLAGRAPELDRPDALELLGRTLARVHAIGAIARFRQRPALSLQRLGFDARQSVLASGFVPRALADRYADISAQLLDRVQQEFDAVGPVSDLRIHGDCHPGNILWRATGPLFVDFDDCVSGPRVQDLWMFLAGGAAEQQSGWAHLMTGYESFGSVDAIELRLIEPLRSLRMLHYAAWLAVRWDDPAFPRAFPWFVEPRYWERHLQDLMEQLANIDEPPLLAR